MVKLIKKSLQAFHYVFSSGNVSLAFKATFRCIAVPYEMERLLEFE